MTDYATLNSDVADFAARTDLTSKIPIFIRQSEPKIAREIRVIEMQQTGTLVVPDTGSIALPTRFLGFKSVAVQTSAGDTRGATINYMPPDRFHELRNNRSIDPSNLDDNYYTLEGGNLLLSPLPGSGATVTLNVTYWQRFETLDGVTVTTNWLLTNHYDLYFAAVMARMCRYEKDFDEEAVWNADFDRIKEDLHRSEKRKARSGPHVRRPRNVA